MGNSNVSIYSTALKMLNETHAKCISGLSKDLNYRPIEPKWELPTRKNDNSLFQRCLAIPFPPTWFVLFTEAIVILKIQALDHHLA